MRPLARLRASPEWQLLFGAIWKADPVLAAGWWALVLLRATLPAALAVATGALVGAVERGEPLAATLVVLGLVFLSLQTLAPLHGELGRNLGSKTSAWLHDRL